MRVLLASTCLTPIALLVAMPAAAQTTITTARTTPVTTSTVNNGAPSDVTITSAGSVTVTSGTAVTVDSNNKATNQGTVQITNADNATGIGAVAGGSGAIENSGKIIIDETYAPTDTDNDGDLDGPFASGTNRAGIRTFGAFTGSITNLAGGSITVEGNDSFGIVLAGPLTGNLSTDGAISVVGDRSVGVRTGDVTGSVRIAGTVTAQGSGASAVQITGNVSGALVLQGAISSTGYRYTTPPASVTTLDADDLLQGGPAVSITGNIAGGVIVAIPPVISTTNTDVDNDGILDANEGSGAITSYGSAAALQVGATGNSVTLGPVANSAGYGLIINGTVAAAGVYTGVSGNGVVIGGLGGAVTVTNGISITGAVTATAASASATALRIGSGATVPVIQNSGIISVGGGTASGQSARGIVVDAGATVGTIRNAGNLTATSGADASAIGIIDLSGGVTLVENSGTITTTGATAGTGRNVAIDLSANTTGATINQTVVTTATAPSITGDIKFGTGNDTFNLADGTVTGNASFGAGANKLILSGDAAMAGNATFGAGADTMSLAGTSVFTGTADFGGGGDTLTLTGTSVFSGTLANAGNLAVTVTGGRFGVTGTGTTAIGSLSVGATGSLGVTIDTTTNTATRYQVAGNANFDAGSTLTITLNGLVTTTNNFTVVSAGSITGASNLTASSVTLPYLYKSGIATGGAANEITISISRKTTTELGLNRSGASAYDAIYAALGTDAKVAGSFLSITDADSFKSAVGAMLPDHAGGAFEAVTSGSRAIGRMLTDGGAPFSDQGKWGYWIEEVAFGRAKSIGYTASYDVNGWGTSGGAEFKTKLGNFGLALAYIHGNDENNGSDNVVASDQYEVALYWRGDWSGLRPFARVSAAKIDFSGTREFSGQTGTEVVTRTADGQWGGKLYSATGGASYEGAVGRLTFRPILSIDYYRLTEDAYAETGGGTAFNLSVDQRVSDELAGNASLAVGLAFGSKEDGWFHAEVEGGRRQILGGELGATTARFTGGQSFTLVPDARTSGWIGRLRASGGTEGFRIGAEVGGEEQQGRAAVSLRATLQLGF
jgi:uncharacterized protein with beta-barrel porin domain